MLDLHPQRAVRGKRKAERQLKNNNSEIELPCYFKDGQSTRGFFLYPICYTRSKNLLPRHFLLHTTKQLKMAKEM